jgi:hypothetical protein
VAEVSRCVRSFTTKLELDDHRGGLSLQEGEALRAEPVGATRRLRHHIGRAGLAEVEGHLAHEAPRTSASNWTVMEGL